MGFDEGRIVLDSANGTYYAGQTVHAKLIFDQDKVKKFRGIYVRMKGYCETHWTTHHTRRVNDRTESYTEHHGAAEVYFEIKQYLVGGTQGEHHLQPGHHELPFYCQIPANVPSSFEGNHGHVRYELRVVVDRAFKLDQEKLTAIRVIAPYNLNNDPYCRDPIQIEFEDTYCCCCMSNGHSETLVKLPAGGYCPGQNIPIELSCDNKSSVEIEKIKFNLEKNVVFRADDNTTRTQEERILAVRKGPVPPNTSRSYTFELDLPAIDVYNMGPCRFIDIEYTLQVKVCPESCNQDSEQTRRIVMGTIPLVGFQDDYRNPLQDQMPMVQAPTTQQPITSQPGYPGTQVFPGGNQSYPYPNQPTVTPYPVPNQPYPAASPPYPVISPYPGNTQSGNTTTLGFNTKNPAMPSLPQASAGGLPYPMMPASAPNESPAPYAPFAPQSNGAGGDEIERQPAFNPHAT